MEENAQLRAEKMLLNTSTSAGVASTVTTTTTTTSMMTTFNATMNNNNNNNEVNNVDQINLYSTIKSKKLSAKEDENEPKATLKQLKQHSNQIKNYINSGHAQCFDSSNSLNEQVKF
jgi:hypothetical protein